jgi:hypothetical protein
MSEWFFKLERRDTPFPPEKCISSGGNALDEVYMSFLGTPLSFSKMVLMSRSVLDAAIVSLRLSNSRWMWMGVFEFLF